MTIASTLVGVTELSRTGHETGKLLREGIYTRLRHPRYASAALGLIGNALLINYLGLNILFLLLIPLGVWLLALEERDWLTASAMRTGSISGRSHNSFPGCEGRVDKSSLGCIAARA